MKACNFVCWDETFFFLKKLSKDRGVDSRNVLPPVTKFVTNHKMKNLIRISQLPFFIAALIFSISCSEDEPVVNEDPEGGVIGFWNSSTSTGASFSLSVSSVLNEEDGVYAGPFFISNNYRPAFGTDNDGSISFKVVGDSIFNFFYDDTIPGCTGTFTGEGKINSEGNFFITFTGTDCDGFHNGTIVLKK